MAGIESVLPAEGDVSLQHPDINSGAPYPFVLYVKEDEKQKNLQQARGTSVSVEVEINLDGDTPQMTKNLFFNILLMDTATLGGEPRERFVDTARLLEIINQSSGIALLTETQVFCGLVAQGHNMTLTEYRNFSIASIRLEKVDFNVIPPNPFTFLNSAWVDEDNLTAVYSKWGDEDSDTPLGTWR